MRFLKLSTLFAVLVAFGLALGAAPQPAAAQTAKKLKCKGCVKSKQIRNEGIKGADIKNNTIGGSKIQNDAIDGGKIASGAVGTDEIKDGSVGKDDLGFDPASAGDIGLLTTMIGNLALLQARGASAYVFVTSETYTGNLGGIAGADAKCQLLAEAAGLPGRYNAWIADSEARFAPDQRFPQAPLAYIEPPGFFFEHKRTGLMRLADDWADLTDGFLIAPIDVNERGDIQPPVAGAWTNVDAGGGLGSFNAHCDNWTSTTNLGSGGTRNFTTVFGAWTDAGTAACSETLHLYCFGQ